MKTLRRRRYERSQKRGFNLLQFLANKAENAAKLVTSNLDVNKLIRHTSLLTGYVQTMGIFISEKNSDPHIRPSRD